MKKSLILFALMLAAMSAGAQNNVLWYSYNPVDMTARVIYPTDKNGNRLKYSGDIVIPDVVVLDEIGRASCRERV